MRRGSYFRVKNFEDFQHYKDRNPPWIKLHNELLENYDFSRLHDASKAHLFAIWLLASRTDNKIPYDAEWIAGKINANTPVDLDTLANLGYIEVFDNENNRVQNASTLLADRKQVACLEGEAETEAETEAVDPSGSTAAPERQKTTKIDFDFATRKFSDIDDPMISFWADAYPACDVVYELKRMAAWLVANPKKRKSDYARFINDWLKREQDNGGSKRNAVAGNRGAAGKQSPHNKAGIGWAEAAGINTGNTG